MKGYLTKTHEKLILTIRDKDNIPHRYRISNFKKFCKNVLHSSVDEVKNRRNVGQYIVDRLGFFDSELWELDTLHYEFP
jgi:hypothetical protein